MSTIAELTDRLRTKGEGGRIMLTEGIQALGETKVAKVLEAVRTFSDFNPDHDPYQ